MGRKDSRVDAYITNAAPFAQPILKRIRKAVHAGYPQVEETIKWSFPHFTRDDGVIICGMAAFKAHCALHFWKAAPIFEGENKPKDGAMGQFGRITSLADLPANDVLAGYVRKAAEFAAQRASSPSASKPRPKQQTLAVPDYVSAALEKNPRAKAAFEGFSHSCRKEYVEWITGAKREATRDQRLATAIEWLKEGKPRNWKYQRP